MRALDLGAGGRTTPDTTTTTTTTTTGTTAAATRTAAPTGFNFGSNERKADQGHEEIGKRFHEKKRVGDDLTAGSGVWRTTHISTSGGFSPSTSREAALQTKASLLLKAASKLLAALFNPAISAVDPSSARRQENVMMPSTIPAISIGFMRVKSLQPQSLAALSVNFDFLVLLLHTDAHPKEKHHIAAIPLIFDALLAKRIR